LNQHLIDAFLTYLDVRGMLKLITEPTIHVEGPTGIGKQEESVEECSP